MVDHNSSETADYTFSDDSIRIMERVRNWHQWQMCLQGASTNFAGRAAFYKVPGENSGGMFYDAEDGELLEVALTIFIRSWGRSKYRKLKNHVASSLPTAAKARNANQSVYLYKSEIDSLLHKVKYCLEYLEKTNR